jgi:hypothetical protein
MNATREHKTCHIYVPVCCRDESVCFASITFESFDSVFSVFLTGFVLTQISVILSPSRTALHFDITHLS